MQQKLKYEIILLENSPNTNWESDPNSLRISALALTYSVAQYCAPVWINSARINKIDTKLNVIMRTMSGTIKFTFVQWFSVLSNITPHHICRMNLLTREWNKFISNSGFPIHNDINLLAQNLQSDGSNPNAKWIDEWKDENSDTEPYRKSNNQTTRIPLVAQRMGYFE